MRASTVGALCLSLCIPSVASAEDVTASLPGANVPVGPTGTSVLNVTRTVVGSEHFAVIRSRAGERASSCGVTPERVAVWGLIDGRWTEMAHELVDRCLAAQAVRTRRIVADVRARIVDVTEAGVHHAEFHFRVIDPRLPLEQSSVVRYSRVGDRFVAQRETDALAPTPGVAPRRSLAALSGALADGRLAEWAAFTPVVTNERGSIWMAQDGDRLAVAGDIVSPDGDAPTLTVHLSDVGVGTGRMRSADGNHGRVVRLTCGDAPGANARCVRVGDRWHLEGSVDMTEQLYARRSVDTVAVLAVAEAGGHRLMSSPGMRLEAMRLAAPVDLLRGASPEVAAMCVGGFMGRMSIPGASPSDPLGGVRVTCGAVCPGGHCEQIMGTGNVLGRLEIANTGTCLRGLGPGAEVVDGCRDGANTRLVGAIEVHGFDAVLAVERAWSADGASWRQGEFWTLVTASAEWRRMTVGEAQRGALSMSSRVQIVDGHPAICQGAGGCEVLDGLTISRREAASASVTGAVVATLREAGLLARREAP